MATVALIGGDGSGKTAVARELIATSPVPMRYLYMGIHVPSANFTLPTSRLAYALKARAHIRRGGTSPGPAERGPYRTVQRGRLGAVARLVNRMTEETYRQIVSWFLQLRGFVVVYDRHYFFEYELGLVDTRGRPVRFTERIHRWFLRHIYPKPDLVILLDASPELLYERKREWGVAHHRERRVRYLERGGDVADFVTVDAAQPLDVVVAEVRDHVHRFLEQ